MKPMIVYGKQIFFYVLEHHPEMIRELYLAKEVDKKLFSRIAGANKKIIKLDPKKAQSLARGGNHQGFLLEIEPLPLHPFASFKTRDFLLLLSGVTDMGNIGAIARSAWALGVEGMIVSGMKQLNLEGAIRSSSGALLDLPVALFPDTATAVNELKQAGFTTYCALMGGEDVREVSFASKKALILGSEGEGIPGKVRRLCDRPIAIKMEHDFDSLNVSAAAAILCDRMRN